MVANITSAPDQLDESISTCRFAQRVAMVSCEVCLEAAFQQAFLYFTKHTKECCMHAQAMVNEELDSALVIARLRAQVDELHAELRCDFLEQCLHSPCLINIWVVPPNASWHCLLTMNIS